MAIGLCGMIAFAKCVSSSTGPAEAAHHTKGSSMKRFVLSVVIACVILLNVSARCQTVPDKEIASRIQAYLQPFGDTGNLIGSVLVARGGRILFRRSYGMANYELRVPNSSETRFHIASVSKPFTAAAILQLQEQGRLSVSDHVSRYVPDFPSGDRITLDNLLTHTSGIPDINGIEGIDTFERSPHTLEQLVAKFASLPLEFAPGSKQSYSNSNYNLLALILEKVSGEGYENYLRRHIFEPAGMKDSGVDDDASRLIPNAASGYSPAGISGFENARYLDWSNKTGNGSLYSTVDDLYRFDRALNTDILLKRATQQKYFVEADDNLYGWYIWNQRLGHRLLAAKGHSLGFTAELDRYPDDDVTVIVLTNSYGTASQKPVSEALEAIVFGQKVPPSPPQRAIAVTETLLASYAGQYQYGPDYFDPNARFTLIPEAGYLLMKIGDHQASLIPVSETEFLERAFFGRILMSKDASGKVTGLTCRYGDKNFTAHRL
jgi:CubicO group peptidase (beta-lactamase class C family)